MSGFQLPRVSTLTGAPWRPGGFAQVSIPDELVAWLLDLCLLRGVPLHYLVPDPALLPPDSLRFVSLDPGLIGRLIEGALAAAALGGGDLQLAASFRAGVFRRLARELTWRSTQATGTAPEDPVAIVTWQKAWEQQRAGTAPAAVWEGHVAGVVVRSELVRRYPGVVVRAAAGGQPLGCVRRDLLAPSILLALFHGATPPDRIELVEPDEGVRFGAEANPATTTADLEVDYRPPAGGPPVGVLEVPMRPATGPTGPSPTVIDLGALVGAISARQGSPADATSVARCLQQAPFVQVMGSGRRPATWGP